jgi:hypothetical protein
MVPPISRTVQSGSASTLNITEPLWRPKERSANFHVAHPILMARSTSSVGETGIHGRDDHHFRRQPCHGLIVNSNVRNAARNSPRPLANVLLRFAEEHTLSRTNASRSSMEL